MILYRRTILMMWGKWIYEVIVVKWMWWSECGEVSVVKWVWWSERLVTKEREYGMMCNLSHREKEKRGEEKRREDRRKEDKRKDKSREERREGILLFPLYVDISRINCAHT